MHYGCGSLPGWRDSKRVKRSGTDPNQTHLKKHGRKTRKDIESTIVNIRKALMDGNEQE
jgi:hypothetical protein